MNATQLIVVICSVLIPSLTGAAVAIIREVRKNAPNGQLTKLEIRMRRLEQRLARVVDHLLHNNPPDDELDAESSGEFRGLSPKDLNNGE